LGSEKVNVKLWLAPAAIEGEMETTLGGRFELLELCALALPDDPKIKGIRARVAKTPVLFG
jgi:hypothetical protein